MKFPDIRTDIKFLKNKYLKNLKKTTAERQCLQQFQTIFFGKKFRLNNRNNFVIKIGLNEFKNRWFIITAKSMFPSKSTSQSNHFIEQVFKILDHISTNLEHLSRTSQPFFTWQHGNKNKKGFEQKTGRGPAAMRGKNR